MERIEYYRYTLHSRDSLNARSSRREHEGALIRIDGGHGCIHPWPELGDESLDDQLASLARRNPKRWTPLTMSAVECAKFDRAARREGRSVFSANVPKSHWLCRPGDDPSAVKSQGFDTVKIKGSLEFKSLRREFAGWQSEGFKIRLDFNESLLKGQFVSFWNSLSDPERVSVEFIEDPEIWSEEGWMDLRDSGIPLAVDRDHENRLRLGDVMALKPAHYGWSCNRETRYYVSTYMDHAIGQMFAAAVAMTYSKNGSNDHLLQCGLLTHRCFENDEFFERIRCDGPRLLPVEGTGLGFDDLLEKLPWKRLN